MADHKEFDNWHYKIDKHTGIGIVINFVDLGDGIPTITVYTVAEEDVEKNQWNDDMVEFETFMGGYHDNGRNIH